MFLVCGVSGLEDRSLDTGEANARYGEWFPFVLRADIFIRDAAVALGYDPGRLAWGSAVREKS